MSDPILDEKEINRLLSKPVMLGTLEEIQHGAMQAMIDLYDRKVTRDYYQGALTQCLTLFSQCSKLWMLNSIHTCYHNNELNEHAFDVTWQQLKEITARQQEAVKVIVADLQTCPTSKDRIS